MVNTTQGYGSIDNFWHLSSNNNQMSSTGTPGYYSDGSGNEYMKLPDGTYTYTGSTSKSSSSGGSSTQANTFVGVSTQTFLVECWGLKPNTIHNAFLVNLDVSADCIPRDSIYRLGADLISSANGQLVFDYQFKPSHSPFDTKKVSGSSDVVAVIPAGNKKFYVSSADGSSYAESFIESKGTVTT